MDFNARGSQQLRATQNHNRGMASQHKQKKDDGDEFMRLVRLFVPSTLRSSDLPLSASLMP